MLITQTEISKALSKANEIDSIYVLNYLDPNRNDKSDYDLWDLTKKYTNRTIEILELNLRANNSSIWSFCAIRPVDCEIVLLSGLNYYKKKFAMCKELFHIILDCEDYRSTNTRNTIDEYLYSGIGQATSIPTQTELLAEMAAMEFLFPYHVRLHVLSGNVNYDDIAEQYKVPKTLVERYLSEHYMKYLVNNKSD